MARSAFTPSSRTRTAPMVLAAVPTTVWPSFARNIFRARATRGSSSTIKIRILSLPQHVASHFFQSPLVQQLSLSGDRRTDHRHIGEDDDVLLPVSSLGGPTEWNRKRVAGPKIPALVSASPP